MRLVYLCSEEGGRTTHMEGKQNEKWKQTRIAQGWAGQTLQLPVQELRELKRGNIERGKEWGF